MSKLSNTDKACRLLIEALNWATYPHNDAEGTCVCIAGHIEEALKELGVDGEFIDASIMNDRYDTR